MDKIRFFDDKMIPVEDYIAYRICRNDGSKSDVYKEDLQKACAARDIKYSGKDSKEDLYKLLLASGLSAFDLAKIFHIGVTSIEFQQAFSIDHKDVKRLERLEVLEVVGHHAYRDFGRVMHAPEYSLDQFHNWSLEDMQELMRKYPKGYRRKKQDPA